MQVGPAIPRVLWPRLKLVAASASFSASEVALNRVFYLSDPLQFRGVYCSTFGFVFVVFLAWEWRARNYDYLCP
jgi:hypothetical protein